MTTSEPTTGENVRKLETLLPPMTNYAESVCAEGAFAHSTYMVWDDPEPYIIKNGIDRLKSQEQTIADKDAKIATLTEKVEAMENDLINLDMNLTEMTARAEQERQWISVQDRLPDMCGCKCLVAAVNKFGQTEVFTAFTGYMERGKLEFHSAEPTHEIPAWTITHWMPLPKPPSDCERLPEGGRKTNESDRSD